MGIHHHEETNISESERKGIAFNPQTLESMLRPSARLAHITAKRIAHDAHDGSQRFPTIRHANWKLQFVPVNLQLIPPLVTVDANGGTSGLSIP